MMGKWARRKVQGCNITGNEEEKWGDGRHLACGLRDSGKGVESLES